MPETLRLKLRAPHFYPTIDGVNYLVPIGARFSAASDVKHRAVAADWVLARMDESGMDVKLLFLDACRANPFGRSWTRAVSQGLAVMETPKGTLIAYATSPGKTASDGDGTLKSPSKRCGLASSRPPAASKLPGSPLP
jgi:uncharacterized caspase-like protein